MFSSNICLFKFFRLQRITKKHKLWKLINMYSNIQSRICLSACQFEVVQYFKCCHFTAEEFASWGLPDARSSMSFKIEAYPNTWICSSLTVRIHASTCSSLRLQFNYKCSAARCLSTLHFHFSSYLQETLFL